MTKIVNDKALAAAHIENMGKASNAGSGDFGHNPEGRDDLASGLGASSAVCPLANKRRRDNALGPNRRRRTHEVVINRPWEISVWKT